MGKKPFSAADPDGPAYNAMIAKHKRLSTEQEAAQYEKIGKTADLADKTLDKSQRAAETLGKVAQDDELLRFANKYGKLTGAAGYALSAISNGTGFQADRKRGMPLDEAFIKHGGRYALGLAGGALGGAAGALVGGGVGGAAGTAAPGIGTVAGAAVGAGAGGLAGAIGGAEAGEYAADRLAAGYRKLKRGETQIQRHIYELTDPLTILRRRDRGLPRLRPAF